MKNKKGFTLIELLAVIVVLAIIALIAVPIILNMIESARKGSAVDSAYGYIEAVENYQAYEMLKGNDGLKEGIYNIVEETTINNTKYKKLTELVKIKGKNPTGGKIGITKNGTVGTATMCVNDYVIEYANRKAEIASEDCGEMGAIVTYNVSSEKWETSKTLNIVYPEGKGKYEYYYKLESGKAKVGEKELTINEEIKTETNTVNIELLENSKITAWMLKNGKKISTKTYEETKIDNVEIGTIEVATTASYPKLTEYGMKLQSQLTLQYEEQEGTSAYYSVDDKATWQKYNGQVNVDATKIYAKLVRDGSKREGEITESTTSVPDDALGVDAYDNNPSTSVVSKNGTIKKYVAVDSSMYGKNIILNYKLNYSSTITLNYYNESELISSKKISTGTSESVTIPNKTTKIEIQIYSRSNLDRTDLYEISVDNIPVINVEQMYPKLTIYGIEFAYDKVTINYHSSAVQKLYKIDDGDWKNYNNETIKIGEGQTIYAKSKDKNGTDSRIQSYKMEILADALGLNAYDNNTSTNIVASYGTIKKYIDVDASMYGKKIDLKYALDGNYITLNYYNGSELFSSTKISSGTSSSVTIPDKTTKIEIQIYSRASSYRTYLYDIAVEDNKLFNIEKVYSKLTQNGIVIGYDEIAIDYFNTSIQKYYKIDDGEWKVYNNQPFKLQINETIYVKIVGENGRIIQTQKYANINIPKTAFDGDQSTYATIDTYPNANELQMKVDSSAAGKYLNIHAKNVYNSMYGKGIYFKFYDSDNKEVGDQIFMKNAGIEYNDKVLIPQTAVKLVISYGTYQGALYIYEMSVSS